MQLSVTKVITGGPKKPGPESEVGILDLADFSRKILLRITYEVSFRFFGVVHTLCSLWEKKTFKNLQPRVYVKEEKRKIGSAYQRSVQCEARSTVRYYLLRGAAPSFLDSPHTGGVVW